MIGADEICARWIKGRSVVAQDAEPPLDDYLAMAYLAAKPLSLESFAVVCILWYVYLDSTDAECHAS